MILAETFDHAVSILSTLRLSLPTIEAAPPTQRSSELSLTDRFQGLGLSASFKDDIDPLDAIVVLDADGKRRLVLPFGWAGGRQMIDETAGQYVLQRCKCTLLDAVAALEAEKHSEQSGDHDMDWT